LFPNSANGLIGMAAGVVWGLSSFSVLPAGIISPAAADQVRMQYTVQSGDSLWSIANRLGVSVGALKQTNNLQSNLIFPSQVLVVPGVGGTAQIVTDRPDGEPVVGESAGRPVESPVATSYTVVAGDTLWSIARRTGVSVAVLKRVNNVELDFLAIGQVLTIPDRGMVNAASAPSRSGDRVRTILDYGRTLLGHPYRWAGSSPGGFDCSGFVTHVFGRHGISLPRTSQAQFNVGTPISRSELQPGDLVFFTTYQAGASHVGIYYGNGRFMHASSAGGSVIWTDLGSQYYSSRFLGGRRVLP
jgi:cell wall-associated NlpC family hydrolase